jgi:hypothetical protein
MCWGRSKVSRSGSAAMSSDSWNLSSISSSMHSAAWPVSPCHNAWTAQRAFPGRVADVCIWQDIEFWLFRVVVWDSLVCRSARAADMSCSIRAGARARSIPASGTERRAAEWNQSRICADFGHAVSLCRMIASLRFSGGAFDVIGTTAWWQSGHWVKASSSPAYISLCAQNGCPYPALSGHF